MNDFQRLEKIFGLDSNKKSAGKPKKSQKTRRKQAKSKRDNQLDLSSSLQLFSSPEVLKIKRSRLSDHSVLEQSNLESPDKAEIIPHISCNTSAFERDLQQLSPTSPPVPERILIVPSVTKKSKKKIFPSLKIPASLKQEIYSPDIEDYSESEDIFHIISQQSEQIIIINNGISDSYSCYKPKYRPINKIPKPGGLLEKLRKLKHKRLMEGASFARDQSARSSERKIQVLQHCEFRRRLLLKFQFDDFSEPDLDEIETHHYLVVPPDFTRFIKKHIFYRVVFDLPEREFISNHFIHFGKMIRAVKKF